MGASGAATCWDCHGSHDMLPVKNPASPVFKLNLPGTCAKCHSNPGLTKEYQMKYPEAAAQYMDSIHGRALLKMGLIVAPSCNDCHGVHDIKRSVDRDSPINHANVAKTCGKCHVGIEETYDKSVHGQLAGQGRQARAGLHRLPHRARDREPRRTATSRAISDQRCGKCHEDRLEHYRDTYHGKAMALGKPNVAPEVAACYDCHGHHDVLPPSNPALAPVQGQHPRHLPAMSSRARRRASPNTSRTPTRSTGRIIPLLHVGLPGHDRRCSSACSPSSALHTAASGWSASVYLYLHDSKTFREAKIETQEDDEWFTRFVPFERFLHFLVVTSFLLLVITGMPLKFYYTDWAKVMFNIIGGAGDRAHAASLRRDRHLPLLRPARGVADRQGPGRAASRLARPGDRQDSASSGSGTCCSARTR